MYPSCPWMSNLCVMAWRSSGSLRRTGCGTAGAACAAGASFFASFDVFSGCIRLLPSR